MAPERRESGVLSVTLTVIVAVLVIAIGQAGAEKGGGRCPSLQAQQNFNTSAYTGVWYEQLRYYGFFETPQHCTTSTFTDAGDSSMTIVGNRDRYSDGSSVGFMYPAVDRKEGKFTIQYGWIFGMYQYEPYWVLETDYISYAIVWRCKDYILYNKHHVWIMTRMKNPDAMLLLTVTYKVAARGIPIIKLRPTLQDC